MSLKVGVSTPALQPQCLDARDDAPRRCADRATLSRIFARTRPELTAIHRVIGKHLKASILTDRGFLFSMSATFIEQAPTVVFANYTGAASVAPGQKERPER